jgi:hypothetical protein
MYRKLTQFWFNYIDPMKLPNTKLWETGIIIQPLETYELKKYSFVFLVGAVCLVKHVIRLKLSTQSTFSFFFGRAGMSC